MSQHIDRILEIIDEVLDDTPPKPVHKETRFPGMLTNGQAARQAWQSKPKDY